MWALPFFGAREEFFRFVPRSFDSTRSRYHISLITDYRLLIAFDQRRRQNFGYAFKSRDSNFFRPPYPPPPLPMGILYSPQFRSHRHPRSHGKIADCEQSIPRMHNYCRPICTVNLHDVVLINLSQLSLDSSYCQIYGCFLGLFSKIIWFYQLS